MGAGWDEGGWPVIRDVLPSRQNAHIGASKSDFIAILSIREWLGIG